MIHSSRKSQFSALLLGATFFFGLFSSKAIAFSLKQVPSTNKGAFLGQTSRVMNNPSFQKKTPSGSTFGSISESYDSGCKSTRKAVLLSFLLPGLGQHYLGEKKKALTFFITEGAIWTSFMVFQVQGHLRRSSSREYAYVFAGISTMDHSDDFFREIGDYDSSKDYERVIKEDGRAELYPDADYEAVERYFVENRVSDYEPWVWRSTEDREHYYDLRWGSRLAFRRSLYAVGAALANRVASAVYALKSSRGMNSNVGMAGQPVKVSFESHPDPSGQIQFGITLIHDF